MKTIINSIKTLQPTRSGMFSASATIALGISLMFVMGIAFPQKAEAIFGDPGDCWDCGGGWSDWEPENDTYNTYDTYAPANDGWSDWTPEYDTYNVYDTYAPSNDGWSNWTPEYETYNVYDTYRSDYSYYPTYYGGSYTPRTYRTDYSGGSSNVNTNVNNNNVHVNVGSGTPDVDGCSNLPGRQPNGYDCYPDDERYDHCSNIGGDQPRGYDCYPDRNDDEPSCDLSVSDTRVEEGDDVTLRWDTEDATYASINQGIGRVDEDGGDERVEIDGDTTFRMTVRNNSGDEDTCSVTVRADEENDFSSVSFVGEPTYNPPVVYLSDIPYTGVEDINPVLLSYWLMLIAAAGGGAWFLYTKGMIPTFAFASVDPSTEGDVEEIAEGTGHATPEVNAFLSALANGDTEAALNEVRDAAATGTGVEEFLASAEEVATDEELKARVSAALAESRETGLIGVKAVLA